MRTTLRITMTLLGVLLTIVTWAQADKGAKPSPPLTASGVVNGATITVNYSGPSVRGRQIFGQLVPYNKPWRAGANQATIVEISKDVKVEGQALPAGKYSLFAIPGENEWTIMFNSETGQWGIKRSGEVNRDPAKDVLTVKVKPKRAESLTERMTYTVTDKGIVLYWEMTEVPIAIE